MATTPNNPITIVLIKKAGGVDKDKDLRNVTVRDDGTLWYCNKQPLLDGTVATDKDVANAKAHKYDLIPASSMLTLGARADGTEVITREEFAKRYAPIAAAEDKAAKLKALRTLTVHLSTRGWGDFTSVEWVGDINTPVEQIVTECQDLLKNGHDVDLDNQTDDEIVAKIDKAKAQHIAKMQSQDEAYAEAKEILDSTTDRTKKAAKQCKFNPDSLHDDIDNPDYWSVAKYVHALEVVSIYESTRLNGDDS